jgi:hypothetical protein
MDWTRLVQDKDEGMAVVSMVTNQKYFGNSSVAWRFNWRLLKKNSVPWSKLISLLSV